jgi:ferredoxin, 2Fe-2S
MSYKDPLIRIIVIADATEVVVETHTYAYPNLMALIADRLYPDNFGECKGRGQRG